MYPKEDQRHCESFEMRQHQLFLPHFKASSGSTHSFVFNPQ